MATRSRSTMKGVLLRSPEPPSLLAWTLRPRPTGRSRLTLSYLVAGAGAAVITLITIATTLLADSCQVGGFGCLGFFFRGIALAVLLGLVVLLGGSLITKLGWLYFLGVLGFALPVVLTGVALLGLGLPVLPIALAAQIAVPAAASWFSHPQPEHVDHRVANRSLIGRCAVLAAPTTLAVLATAVV